MAQPGDFDFYCEEALTGKTKVKKIYESDKVLAFYHTKPVYKTHIVVIPKNHIHNLMNIEENLLIQIFNTINNILKNFDIDTFGGRVITNLGKFQDTPHLHFHVVSDGDYQDIRFERTE